MKITEIDKLIEIVREDMRDAPTDHLFAITDALRELKSLKQKKKPSVPTRHRYGEYNNVLLSDDELEKLRQEFPRDWRERIEELSAAIAAKGYSYRSHLAVIRNWARREQKQASGNVFLDIASERRGGV